MAGLQQRRCYKDEMVVGFFFILVTSCCATFRFEVSRLLYREALNHRQGVMCLPASIQPGQRLPTAGPPREHPPPESRVTLSPAWPRALQERVKPNTCLPPLVAISDS